MSSTSYLGLLPIETESESDVNLSDGEGHEKKMSALAAVRYAAASEELCLVVPDAYDLTHRVIRSVKGRDVDQGCEDLCALASTGRLICRKTALQLIRDAGESFLEGFAGSNQEGLANDGPKLIAQLGAVATKADVPNSTQTAYGPGIATGQDGNPGETRDRRYASLNLARLLRFQT